MITDSKKLKILLKDCAQGFYQHMFFLGKDVMHPRGNQLNKYGFEKSPSLGLKGTSCYGLKTDEQLIELYGSCAGVYSEASQLVFLRERCKFYHWLPEHHLIAGQWSLDDVDSGSAESIFEAVTPLLKWWVHYEKWIAENFDTKYREQCYKDWSKIKSRPCWLPPELAVSWVSEFLEKRDLMDRPKKLLQNEYAIH